MGKDFDWKETDRLVEQLRAKLAEDPDLFNHTEELDLSSPAPVSDPSIPVEDEATRQRILSKRAERREAARLRRERAAARKIEENSTKEEENKQKEIEIPTNGKIKAVFEEEIPTLEKIGIEEAAEEHPKAKEPPAAAPAPAKQEKKASDSAVQEREEAPTDVPQAEEAKKEPPRRKVVRAGAAVPTTNRKNLFASAYHKNDDDYVPRPALSGKKTPTRRVETKLPTAEEIGAETTVEDLLQDLFGTSAGWIAEREKQAVPVQQVVELNIAEDRPEPVPAPVPAQVPQESEELALTMREQDGQMSLVLPEVNADGPEPEAEPETHTVHRKTLEERISLNDDGQINLFSVISAEESDRSDGDESEEERAARLRDRMELKRTVESSEDDFELLMGLDYENELGHAIGFERIRQYHEIGVNGNVVEPRKNRRRFGELVEFEAQNQDTYFRKKYTRQKREHVMRLVISLVLLVLIAVYEGTNAFGALFGGPFDGDRYPVSYIFIGIQLLVLAAFFSRKRLIEGFVRLVRFTPIDYSLCSVMLIATLLYHGVLLFFVGDGKPELYLSPAAVSIVLLAVADLLDWYRESLAFQVVSSRKQKCALIPRVSVGGREGNARAALEGDDGTGTVWYVRSVGFVRNYFANTNKRVAHSRTLGAQLLLILSIACVAALLVLAFDGGWENCLRTLTVTFLLCSPTASLLVTSIPMFMAATLRLRKKSAIIGEEPIYKCAGPTTLVLPDNDVFTSMHHERFELVEDCDAEQVILLVRALLDRLESPLRDSVSVDRDLRLDPASIELDEIEDCGVRATADEGKTVILMGNMDYMQRYGIRVQPRGVGDYEDICRRLLCVAVNNKVSALFLARYRLGDSMSSLLRELEEGDVQLMIRTKDPGVNNALLQHLLQDRRDPVRVMKPSASEIDLNTDRVDATIVSIGSCKEAARTFVTCRRIRRVRHLGKILQALSVAVGGLIAGLLSVLVGAVEIHAVLVSLYLLTWSGLHAAASYFYLREKSDE
jgi:sulfur carrier protein ThiS